MQDTLVKAWQTRWRVAIRQNFPPGLQPSPVIVLTTFFRKRRTVPLSTTIDEAIEPSPTAEPDSFRVRSTTAFGSGYAADLHGATGWLHRYFEEMDYGRTSKTFWA